MRAVVDTNLIISTIFWKGAPKRLYQAAAGQYQLLTSRALIAELGEVIHRPQFAQRLAAIGEIPREIMGAYMRLAEIVQPATVPDDSVRDPKDRIVLGCAVGGRADYIVSGDKDLLTLERYENIPIINATQFLEQLEGDTSA